jgi:ADP-ribose pyrophosphatase
MHIHKIEPITHEKWLNLYAATFEHNGHTGRWVFASRKKWPHSDRTADAVIIVPVLHVPNEPPRLVMIKEYRVPVGDYVFAFPAGLLEPGEDIVDTVRRELQEETGMEVVAVKRITQPLYSSAGLTDEAVAMAFVDARTTPEMLPKLDHSEELEVLLLDHNEVCRLCDDRSARIDARAWGALYLYQQLGRFV